MSFDIASLKRDLIPHLRTILPGLLPGGKFEGNNYVALCPWREDHTLGSFKIDLRTGICKDFADPDAKAIDIIELWQRVHGCGFQTAVAELTRITRTLPPREPERATGTEPMILVQPVPENAPPLPARRTFKKDGKWVHYPFTFKFPYHNSTGELLGYVVRYETPSGKETVPLTLWTISTNRQTGKLKWRYKGFPKPRPLYNLPALSALPSTGTLILVEGEKCVDSLQALLPLSYAALSWMGGANGIHTADFEPLRGRNLILWPDADQPGREAMISIAGILTAKGCAVQLITVPAEKPPGWDVADAIASGWKLPEIFKFIEENARAVNPEQPLKPSEGSSLSAATEPKLKRAAIYEPATGLLTPFRILGHNYDQYYYVSNESLQLKSIRGANHTSSELITLAPLSFWESSFPGEHGPNFKQAHDYLIRSAHRKGIFDAANIRGRGAWFDADRVVIHLGDHLLINGKPTPIERFETKFIYNALPPLEIDNAAPLTIFEAYRLREILEMLFWENPISAIYLAGWLAIAPICGALENRPHIWLTGGKGTGKTAIMERIINPTLGHFKEAFLGNVTEAGIRQTMKCDARPVTIDEAESKGDRGSDRLQNILDLARQAFSESEAKIVKGSPDGKAQEYKARYSMLFSSIIVGAEFSADVSRIQVLSLIEPFDKVNLTKEEHWRSVLAAIKSTITPAWAASFRARSFALIATIRANAAVFASAVAEKNGNRRAGDLIGPLLAGAYSLSSDGLISEKEAVDYVNKQDWTETREQVGDRDEVKCLQTILAAIIEVGKGERISIYEIIRNAYEAANKAELLDGTIEINDQALRRHGIALDPEGKWVFVADNHPQIKKILADSAWKTAWGRILRRLPGTKRHTKSLEGTDWATTRIPLNDILKDDK